jgi:hypothetical protein
VTLVTDILSLGSRKQTALMAVGLRGKAAVNSLTAFGWGCAGSFAIEVVLFCDAVRHSRANRIPALYRRPGFILGRMLLVVVAGLVAAAWGISQPLQGLAVGAGTPQLMLSLTRFRFTGTAPVDKTDRLV